MIMTRPLPLTPPYGMVAADLGNSSSDVFSVMTSCLLHSNYSSIYRPVAWLLCDSIKPPV